eukprot:TRINITY_DN10018_c0_g2_i1.p1 TRINITY_DN10018_c0_g2~~TRINITY_DN10018_c0_g2_i1.p1  ORF type:complete len:366 (-),score=89.72 TRINITY_DN10018_c0_g2_i1:280-1377(-)
MAESQNPVQRTGELYQSSRNDIQVVQRGGQCCECCAPAAGGKCRVTCFYCIINVLCRCCRFGITECLKPVVGPQDYPGWPGWSAAELDTQVDTLGTGDVLLMCSEHPYGKYARVLGNTVWDHVAVVLKHRPRVKGPPRDMHDMYKRNPKLRSYHKECSAEYCKCFDTSEHNELELLESTGEGVHIYNLKQRLWGATAGSLCARYKIVAVRRLQDATLSQEDLMRAERFVAEVRGRPFELNDQELRTAIMREQSTAEAWDSMYCAELQGEFLQQLGVVCDSSYLSNEFLPCDFSTQNQHWGVQTCNGTLGAEEIIKSSAVPMFKPAASSEVMDGDLIRRFVAGEQLDAGPADNEYVHFDQPVKPSK